MYLHRLAACFALSFSIAALAQTPEPGSPPEQNAPATTQQQQTAQPQPAQQPPAPIVRPTPSELPTENPAPAKVDGKDADSAKADNGRSKKKGDDDAPIRADMVHNPVLWHDPGTISSLDMFWGQGGEKHQPQAPFTFDEEDMAGTNPKFDVHDGAGHKWRVKLGEEVRPEVVASRLMWAMGYYVNDDYVVTQAEIRDIHMKRGGDRVKNGVVSEARFSRKPSGQKKIGIWEWKQNPFTGTREFNGLRVMMALMNGWDLKDVNNAVYNDKDSGQQLYICSDIGATFGANGLDWTRARSKGNIDSFKDSKFITRQTSVDVDFGTPKAPSGKYVLNVKDYSRRLGYEWIGKEIPRQDAKWIGAMLGQLSHQQLVDAFRAGHFPQDQIDAYVSIVESRIQELKAL